METIIHNVYEPRKVVAENGEPSLTHQSHTERCNIKNIISKFDNIGQLKENQAKAVSYFDASQLQREPGMMQLMNAKEAEYKARQELLRLQQEQADQDKADLQAFRESQNSPETDQSTTQSEGG